MNTGIHQASEFLWSRLIVLLRAVMKLDSGRQGSFRNWMPLRAMHRYSSQTIFAVTSRLLPLEQVAPSLVEAGW